MRRERAGLRAKAMDKDLYRRSTPEDLEKMNVLLAWGSSPPAASGRRWASSTRKRGSTKAGKGSLLEGQGSLASGTGRAPLPG